jgi:hypothetical protein
MNSNKSQQPPAKKPGANPKPSKNGISSRPVTPTPGKVGNGYVPRYAPPAEPTILPAPNVENRIDIPHSMNVVTMEDLAHRITGIFNDLAILKYQCQSNVSTANASIMYPGIPIKVTTAITASGVAMHALVVTPKNTERETSRWKVEVKGPAINLDKLGENHGRRRALEALLETVEKRVGKELLG